MDLNRPSKKTRPMVGRAASLLSSSLVPTGAKAVGTKNHYELSVMHSRQNLAVMNLIAIDSSWIEFETRNSICRMMYVRKGYDFLSFHIQTLVLCSCSSHICVSLPSQSRSNHHRL